MTVDGLLQPAAQGSDSAAEQYCGDIHAQHQQLDCGTDAPAHTLAQLEGAGLPCLSGFENLRQWQLAGATPGPADGSPSGEGFDAAALSAGTGSSLLVDGEVADLPGHPLLTTEQFAVDDDTGGHPGADIEIGHRFRLRGVGGVCAQCGGFDVILHSYGDAQRCQCLAEVEVFELEVHRMPDPPAGGINLARDTDAETCCRFLPVAGELCDGVVDSCDDPVCAGDGGLPQPADDLSLPVEGNTFDFGAADIQAEPQSAHLSPKCAEDFQNVNHTYSSV